MTPESAEKEATNRPGGGSRGVPLLPGRLGSFQHLLKRGQGSRTVRPLLLLAAFLFLLFGLGFDQAGRIAFSTFVRATPPGGKATRRTLLAPAGSYRVILRSTFAVGETNVRVQLGKQLFTKQVRSIDKRYYRLLPLGTIETTGAKLPIAVFTDKAGGLFARVELEPAGILPISRARLQRLCLALAVFLVSLALLPRHPFALAGLIAGFPLYRLLLFGVVPFIGGDQRTAFFPWWELTRRLLSSGKLPLWNSHTFLGIPHLANIQTQILFPPTFLLGLLDVPFPAWETILTLLKYLLAFSGTWLLARRLRFRRLPAALCGVLYMLSYVVVSAVQPTVSLTSALIPWLIAAFVRPRGILFPALVLAMTLLAGHTQYTTYGLVGVCCFALPGRKRAVRRSAALLLGVVLASVLLLPFLEYAGSSIRSLGLSPNHARLGGLMPDYVDLLLDPGLDMRDAPPLGSRRPTAAPLCGLLGLPLVACTLAGMGRRRRANLVRIMAMGATGLALALGDLGPFSPYHYLVSVPPFSASRGPARATVLCILAVALLAGQGIVRLSAAARKPKLLVMPALLCPILLLPPALLAFHLGSQIDLLLGRLAWDLLFAGVFLAIPLLLRRRLATALVACSLVLAVRADDMQGARPGSWPSLYSVQSPHPRTPHLRDLANVSYCMNDSLVTGSRSPYGYDPVIPRRTAYLWNRIDPDQFPFDARGRLAAPPKRLPASRLFMPSAIATLRAMGTATLTVRRKEARLARPLLSARPPLIAPLPHHPSSFLLRGAARARLTRSYRPVSSMEEARRLLVPEPSRFGLLGELRILRDEETYTTAVPTTRGPIRIESFLKDGRSLAQGAAACTMTLFRDGAEVAAIPLRAGVETADAELKDPAARQPPGHRLARVARSYSISLSGRTLPLHVYWATIAKQSEPFDRILLRKAPGPFLVYLSRLAAGAKAKEAIPLFPPLVEGAVPFESVPGRTHPLIVEDVDETLIRIALPRIKRPMLLVVSAAFYPGWEATVDGQRRPILPADIAFRAVAVKPGDRQVEMIYRPNSYRFGLFFTCIGLIVVGGLLIPRRRLAGNGK